MGDTNMACGRLIAASLVQRNEIPEAFQDPDQRAKLIDGIDKVVFARIVEMESTQLWSEKDHTKLFDELWAGFSNLFPPDAYGKRDGVNILLRLWAGGISGMKVVATETNDGPCWPSYRALACANLWLESRWDPVMLAGLLVGSRMRALRGQKFSFAGLPPEWEEGFRKGFVPEGAIPDYGFQLKRWGRLQSAEAKALDILEHKERVKQAENLRWNQDGPELRAWFRAFGEFEWHDWIEEDTPSTYTMTAEQKAKLGRPHDQKVEAGAKDEKVPTDGGKEEAVKDAGVQ